MTHFRSVAQPSDEDGWKCAREGVPVRSIGYGYTCNDPIPPTENWRFLWVNTRGMGNHGDLIALPLTPAARVAYMEGQMRSVRRAGVAEAWVACIAHVRYPGKHKVLALLSAITQSPQMLAHARAFADVHMFRRMYGELLPEHTYPMAETAMEILRKAYHKA